MYIQWINVTRIRFSFFHVERKINPLFGAICCNDNKKKKKQNGGGSGKCTEVLWNSKFFSINLDTFKSHKRFLNASPITSPHLVLTTHYSHSSYISLGCMIFHSLREYLSLDYETLLSFLHFGYSKAGIDLGRTGKGTKIEYVK